MKKLLVCILIIAIAIPLFTACAASMGNIDNNMYYAHEGGADGSSWASDSEMGGGPVSAPAPEAALFESAYSEADMSKQYDSTAGTFTAGPAATNYAEKIIYTYYANIETIEFDETLGRIQELIDAHGAFIENSSITGSSYDNTRAGRARYRTAIYTIRVPAGQLNTVTGKLDNLGNVVSRSSNADNITSQFLDNESRLKSLRIQEERLLDMLSKAEDVPDLITIESTLADVRYQIERITTMLNHWQHQVDYSTLTLSVSEVEEYMEPPPPVSRTYWERMGDGLMSTLRSTGRFFTNLFMWLVVNAPVLIILAIVIFVIFFVARRGIRKSREKSEQRARERAAAYKEMYPQTGAAWQYSDPQPADPQPPAVLQTGKNDE